MTMLPTVPRRKKKKQYLTDLLISEISLVDSPANSSVDEFGRKTPHATVALYKRDTSSERSSVKDATKMKLSQILKSASRTRAQISDAIDAKAIKLAKREGILLEQALLRTWTNNVEALVAYEACALPKIAKRAERSVIHVTQAEGILDRRAISIAKREGISYAKAVQSALEADPSLYAAYEREQRAGSTYAVPTPSFRLDTPFQKEDDSDDEDEDEADSEDLELSDDSDVQLCAGCKKGMAKSAKFCSSCGKAKSRTA